MGWTNITSIVKDDLAESTDTLELGGGLTTGGAISAQRIHLTSTVDASGSSDNNVGLIVGTRSGAHMTIDTNEVIAKSSGTAETQLYLGETLGKVTIGGVKYGVNNTLWSGVYYMSASHTVTLSASVSAQAHGIVLVWCWYGSDGTAWNQDYCCRFVPKAWVASHSGAGVNMESFCVDGHMMKYVYITDTTIKGYSANTGSQTVGSVTFANSSYVLRYVIGV